MKITFSDPRTPDSGALVVGVYEGGSLTPSAAALDKRMKGALKRAMKASRFKGAPDQTLQLVAPEGIGNSRVLMVGLGSARGIDARRMRNMGGAIIAALGATGDTAAAVFVDEPPGKRHDIADLAANLGYGAALRAYRFDKYRTTEKKADKPSLRTLTVMVAASRRARTAYAAREALADGVFFTRDLVSEPANELYPESFARRLRALTKLGVGVEILDGRQMQRLGMGALLGVAQGSARAPRLVVMRWNGAPKGKSGTADRRPLAFIGKGVTFDSGGISIKPAGGMEDMKWDMGGAAVVSGLMHALAARKAKVNIVGIVGLVENMPSSTAQRPGDVVKSHSGQTIEVINTDAEGRLVLADALSYCQKRFKPQCIVDLATLTGAIIVSLGDEMAGLFCNNDRMARRLEAAGKAEDEMLWRMPLPDSYDKRLNSDIADMKNVTSDRGGGSITAALFLKRFVKDVPWAHLDIAGVTWSGKATATAAKGATGFGVRLLDRFVADNYEES